MNKIHLKQEAMLGINLESADETIIPAEKARKYRKY